MTEKKPGDEPITPRIGGKKPPKPEAPKPPSAPTEKNIQDKDSMPDLNQFNFMNW